MSDKPPIYILSLTREQARNSDALHTLRTKAAKLGYRVIKDNFR